MASTNEKYLVKKRILTEGTKPKPTTPRPEEFKKPTGPQIEVGAKPVPPGQQPAGADKAPSRAT
jgi:hypothetical protein